MYTSSRYAAIFQQQIYSTRRAHSRYRPLTLGVRMAVLYGSGATRISARASGSTFFSCCWGTGLQVSREPSILTKNNNPEGDRGYSAYTIARFSERRLSEASLCDVRAKDKADAVRDCHGENTANEYSGHCASSARSPDTCAEIAHDKQRESHGS